MIIILIYSGVQCLALGQHLHDEQSSARCDRHISEVEGGPVHKLPMEVEEIDAARASLEAEPNVRVLKEMFGAELVADSVEPLPDK